MTLLAQLAEAVASGAIEVVDLTAPLSANPDPAAAGAVREHDPVPARGDQPLRRARPGLVLEQHPHRRAHRHPPRRARALGDRTGTARTSRRSPPRALIAPAVVLDVTDRVAEDPDFLLQMDDVAAWEAEHGPLPDGGWLLLADRVGRALDDQEQFLNADETGPHTPGVSVECARWLAEETPVIGLGVETVGTDAGSAPALRPAVPVPLLPAGRRQVRPDPAAEPRRLPPTGAVLVVVAAADRRRLGQPGPGAGAGRAVTRRRGWSARTLAELGAARVRRRRQRQLRGHQRAARARRAVRRRAARGRGRDDGRRVRADERPGAVLSVHQGCGLTNAMTGIAEAAKSRTPMLVLAADTAGRAVRSNFRIDQDALAARGRRGAPSGCTRPASAVADTVRAYRTAVHERRTVVLNLPLDVQAAARRAGRQRCRAGPPGAARPDRGRRRWPTCSPRASGRCSWPGAAPAGRARAAGAGRGCGALLATSAVANGLFAREPWSLGISGGFASPASRPSWSPAPTWWSAWGCALNMWTMRHGKLIGADATVVQVDVEQAALGAHRPIDLGVLGDVGRTAVDVLAGWPARRGRDTAAGGRAPGSRREGRWRDVAATRTSPPATGSTRACCQRGSTTCCPRERTCPSTPATSWATRAPICAVPDEYGFCFTQAFQSIGLGLATAIGAALARPDRLPIAALGDGGFLMGVADLETAVRLRPAVGGGGLQRRRVRRGGPPLHRGATTAPSVPGDRPRRDRARLRRRAVTVRRPATSTWCASGSPGRATGRWSSTRRSPSDGGVVVAGRGIPGH